MALQDYINEVQSDIPALEKAFHSQLSEFTREKFNYVVDGVSAFWDAQHSGLIFEVILCSVDNDIDNPPARLSCKCATHAILSYPDVRSYELAALRRMCQLVELVLNSLTPHLMRAGNVFHNDVIKKIMVCAREVSVVSAETLNPKQREARVRHLMDKMAQDVCSLYQKSYIIAMSDEVAEVKFYVIDHMHDPRYGHLATRQISLAGPNAGSPSLSVGGHDAGGSQP